MTSSANVFTITLSEYQWQNNLPGSTTSVKSTTDLAAITQMIHSTMRTLPVCTTAA
jgi:hypothetical protein